MRKPKWFKEPLTDKDKIHHGCLNCGGTSIHLDLKTVLYNSFGGWSITKDGKHFFAENPAKEKPFNKYKKLKAIERLAKQDPKHDWRAILFNPLRGAVYQRQGDGVWNLIESNQGFA